MYDQFLVTLAHGVGDGGSRSIAFVKRRDGRDGELLIDEGPDGDTLMDVESRINIAIILAITITMTPLRSRLHWASPDFGCCDVVCISSASAREGPISPRTVYIPPSVASLSWVAMLQFDTRIKSVVKTRMNISSRQDIFKVQVQIRIDRR